MNVLSGVSPRGLIVLVKFKVDGLFPFLSLLVDTVAAGNIDRNFHSKLVLKFLLRFVKVLAEVQEVSR